MENKYYAPEDEEFRIGFEFYSVREIDESIDGPYIIRDCYDLESQARNCWKNYSDILVKYLDKEDIESLGFKKSNKNSWIGYKDYYLNNINPAYPYFLFATIHIPIRDDMYKIMVHRYYNENEEIYMEDNYREPTCVFIGKIKNKSELKRLLKQLNILD